MEQLMLFQEDFPANHLALPGSEKAKKMTVTSGLKCLELSEKLNRPLLLAKMLLASLVWKMAKHLKGYSLTWKMKGIKPNHLLFQLVPLGHGIDETEFGSYATGDKLIPTPDALNGGEITNLRADSNILQGGSHSVSLTHYITLFPTPDCSDRRSQKSRQKGLSNVVKYKLWPTVMSRDWKEKGGQIGLNQIAEMLPTPSTPRPHDTEKTVGTFQSSQNQKDLTIVAKNGGQLNPNWVEWLMGYPIGYTDLKH